MGNKRLLGPRARAIAIDIFIVLLVVGVIYGFGVAVVNSRGYSQDSEYISEPSSREEQLLVVVSTYGDDSQRIYVDRETKVEYVGTRVKGWYGGSFGLSVRLDADGKPILYEGEL